MEPNTSTTYNTPFGIWFNGSLDDKKLEKCLQILIDRHNSLRTYFTMEQNELVQKVVKSFDFTLSIEDKNTEDLTSIWLEFIKPFDLEKLPLFRIKLLRFSDTRHLLLLDFHHIICDGTSINIFLEELSALYQGKTLSNQELDYKDYAVYENKQKNSSTYETMKNYWKEKLSGELPVLTMPTNYVRPSIQDFAGNSIIKTIPNFKALNQLCKTYHTTPYLFLLSVYYILLYRYTGQEDIIVGTASANRNLASLKNVMGMFVNTLAIREQILPEATFLEFLNTVTQNCLTVFENEGYPFDELVKDLNLTRDSSRNPLFDTMFVYQNDGLGSLDLPDLKISTCLPENPISKFDFSMDITPFDDYLQIRLEYRTSLFTHHFMEQFLNHYITLVTAVLNCIDAPLATLPMLTQKEQEQITSTFNATDLAYDETKTLVQLFEQQVSTQPKQTAIYFENTKITYEELNQKANQIAHLLVSKNVKRNQIIGILLPRTPELLCCMWGILKAGAGYMLIDSTLPYDRILYMLENANSPYFITSHKMKEIDTSTSIYLEDVPLKNYSTQNLNSYSDNEDSFCVIYTSGSTGTPKGVELKRKGVINLLENYKKYLSTDYCQNFLSMSSIAFDMFLVENFVSLLSGGSIIFTNDEEQKIPVYTNKLIEKHQVNFILTTPSRMELLLSNIQNENAWKSIKVIQLGGEVFPDHLYEKMVHFAPNAHVFNGYGPSEITACCSSKEVTSSDDITIGTPFGNTQIWICDKQFNLCPIGVEGELCIGGYGLAKGYIHNPEMTQKSFIPNPFGNGLLYKTGDIAKYTENGEIAYIGRRDFQIKIRGLRVELSEIEKQFLKIPSIKNVCVIYKKEANPYLAAFFTATTKLEIAIIRDELASYLPLYMVPKYIIQLDDLPITLNGKINKKLLENYSLDSTQIEDYVAPTTELEELFCTIWEHLLNTKIGIDNDIFEMGADSLLAIKFKTELLSHNINVAYADIFKYKTVRTLATVHEETQNSLFTTMDFSMCNQVLEKNIPTSFVKAFANLKKSQHNNVLLLGANGFVGMHILYELVQKDSGNIYCIIRNKYHEDAKTRFLNALHFYFRNELDSYLNQRIFVLSGNILEPNLGLSTDEYKALIVSIDTVVNAAAMVKHYGNEDDFRAMNIDLTQNLVDLCTSHQKRLFYISTLSVSGNMSLDGDFSDRASASSEDMNFAEHHLYIGQNLDNEYIKSKFMAEKLVLDAIYQNNLQAKILRLGNITSRYSDGKFQINHEENAFFNRLTAFIKLGMIPDNLLDMYIEFTPVDSCAKAIVTILQNDVPDFSVYHVYDDHHVFLKQLLDALEKQELPIKAISKMDFKNQLDAMLKSKKDTATLSGIINDFGPDKELNYQSNIHILSDFTKAFLYHVGFEWPVIDDIYLQKYLAYMKNLF